MLIPTLVKINPSHVDILMYFLEVCVCSLCFRHRPYILQVCDCSLKAPCTFGVSPQEQAVTQVCSCLLVPQLLVNTHLWHFFSRCAFAPSASATDHIFSRCAIAP
jgi:hypothetical protein